MSASGISPIISKTSARERASFRRLNFSLSSLSIPSSSSKDSSSSDGNSLEFSMLYLNHLPSRIWESSSSVCLLFLSGEGGIGGIPGGSGNGSSRIIV